MDNLNLRQRFYWNLAGAMLIAGALSAGGMTAIHFSQPRAHELDRIVPAAVTLLMVGALLYLYRYPRRPRLVMFWVTLAMGGVLALSSAVFLQQALSTGHPLIELLPAVPGVLMCTLVVQLLFLRPRIAVRVGLGIWAPVALPLIGYLLLHPEELQSRRGQEMLVLLGPASLLMLVMIPFRAATERRLYDLQRSELRARVLAARDPLTDLFNRRAFETQLASVIAQRSSPQQLILLDVDHFKSINDRFGHPVGDQVLIEVARRCARLLNRGELLARWGGEEFAALCREPLDDPRAMAEAMRRAIADAPFADAGPVRASFGVTRVRADDSLESALQRADAALYRAKQAGRDRVEVG